MNKNTFIITLRERLKGLPSEDIDKSVDYYCELIEDRIEEGESEEEAIAALGSIDEIVQKILADTPLTKLVKTKIEHKNQTSLWVIILIILAVLIFFYLYSNITRQKRARERRRDRLGDRSVYTKHRPVTPTAALTKKKTTPQTQSRASARPATQKATSGERGTRYAKEEPVTTGRRYKQ